MILLLVFARNPDAVGVTPFQARGRQRQSAALVQARHFSSVDLSGYLEVVGYDLNRYRGDHATDLTPVA
jgi:hypothetical protein